jgi:molybdopterin molybdotransferase
VTEDTRDGRAELGERTPLSVAWAALRDLVTPHSRTVDCSVGAADGRTLAEPVTAPRDVPGYRRAAMDGFAIRAAETAEAEDASDGAARSGPESDVTGEGTRATPDGVCARLRRVDPEGPVGPGEAAPVHTGSEVPVGADAVVRVERTRTGPPSADSDSSGADDAEVDAPFVDVTTTVEPGANVSPPDEDVASGTGLFAAGRQLRPSDLALCRSVGVDTVVTVAPPRVSVVPTGEELVPAGAAPGPGEVVETNGLMVAGLVERWGGEASYRDIVTDDPEALRAALRRDADHDLVVTTGGSSVGDRDLTPAAVADLGSVHVHDVAIKPGHPVAVGDVDGTPAVTLPGYPVSCLVTAVQFVRPAIAWTTGREPSPHPSLQAQLAEPIDSDEGVRTFVHVRRCGSHNSTNPDDGTEAEGPDWSQATPTPPAVEPVPTAGASVLSSVAAADGWVVVPEDRTGIPAGEPVAVQQWESSN